MSEETAPGGQAAPRKNPLFAKYETSASAEADGRPFTPNLMAGLDDAPVFILARLGGKNNKRIQREREKLTRQQRAAAENMPDEAVAAAAFDNLINMSLVGWENMQDENCDSLPFSK